MKVMGFCSDDVSILIFLGTPTSAFFSGEDQILAGFAVCAGLLAPSSSCWSLLLSVALFEVQ